MLNEQHEPVNGKSYPFHTGILQLSITHERHSGEDFATQ